MSEQETDATEHYVYCAHCGRGHTEFSVIVNGDGEMVQLECKRCGGTDWKRGMEAGHV